MIGLEWDGMGWGKELCLAVLGSLIATPHFFSPPSPVQQNTTHDTSSLTHPPTQPTLPDPRFSPSKPEWLELMDALRGINTCTKKKSIYRYAVI